MHLSMKDIVTTLSKIKILQNKVFKLTNNYIYLCWWFDIYLKLNF